MTITVIAGQPLKAEKAADALAKEVIERTSAQYVDTKITAFNDQLASIQDQLDTLVPRIAQLEQAVNEPALTRSTSSSSSAHWTTRSHGAASCSNSSRTSTSSSRSRRTWRKRRWSNRPPPSRQPVAAAATVRSSAG